MQGQKVKRIQAQNTIVMTRKVCLIMACIYQMLLLTSCNHLELLPQQGHRDSTLEKNPAELATLQERAAEGNREAAWAIYLHYLLGVRDRAKAEPWLITSARLAHPYALKTLQDRQEPHPTNERQ